MPKKIPIWDQRMIMLMGYCTANGIEKTQGAFLKRLGLKDTALSQIKNGESSFRPKHFKIVAELYQVDINWLFGLSEQMKRKTSVSAIRNLKDAVLAIEEEYKNKQRNKPVK